MKLLKRKIYKPTKLYPNRDMNMEQLSLFEPISKFASSQRDKINLLCVLEKKVFIYDTSVADERFFRQKIVDFIKGDGHQSFHNTIWHAVWERNDKGKTLKYCDFNEYRQRVYLDRKFNEWAGLMCDVLAEQISILKTNDSLAGYENSTTTTDLRKAIS